VIGRGNLLTSISFPSQDSGTLTGVIAVLCEWETGPTRKWEGTYGPRHSQRAFPAGVIRWRDCAPRPRETFSNTRPSRRPDPWRVHGVPWQRGGEPPSAARATGG
jgi:hypothetical protein